MSSVTPTQRQVLLELTGLAPRNGRRHRRPTLEVLQDRGLIDVTHVPTRLGKVTARLDGWVLNERQRRLIESLADGEVMASGKYHLRCGWDRAPGGTLRKLCAAGAAQPAGRPGWYTATNLGHELALILRQQPLPPPVGFEGGVSR